MATKAPARKKVAPKIEHMNSWEEVDRALAEIGIKSATIEADEARYNADEQSRRERLTIKLAPLRERIEELELGIERFVTDNRVDLGSKKSKELTHGVVSFRLATPSVQKDKRFTWDGIVSLMQKAGDRFKAFVRVKAEINKEALLQNAATFENSVGKEGIDPAVLKQDFGITVEQVETFGYVIKQAVDNN